MKLYISLLLVCISLSFITCRDKDIQPINIEGKWELESSFGGWSGLQKYPPGNGSIIIFKKNNYEKYLQGKLVKNGTYQITRATSFMTNTIGNQIIFDGNLDTIHSFIEINDGKLTLAVEAYDAGSTTYGRISK
jgi:hypothetical protein